MYQVFSFHANVIYWCVIKLNNTLIPGHATQLYLIVNYRINVIPLTSAVNFNIYCQNIQCHCQAPVISKEVHIHNKSVLMCRCLCWGNCKYINWS